MQALQFPKDKFNKQLNAIVAKLDQMELFGIPSRLCKSAARPAETIYYPATDKKAAYMVVKEVKLRCAYFVEKLGRPFEERNGDGHTVKVDCYPIMASLVTRLISMHVTSAAAECNWSIWGQVYADARRNRLKQENAHMLIAIMSNYRKKRMKNGDGNAFVEDEAICLDFLDVEDEDELDA